MQAAHTTRSQFTNFSQGAWQLLRDGLHIENNAALAESTIRMELCALKQTIRIAGIERTVPRVVSGFETAPADFNLLIIDEENCTSIPPEDATNCDWWAWARNRPAGVTFVPMDAKHICLSTGLTVHDRQRHYYHYSATKTYKDRVDDASVIIGLVEGEHNHLFIVPTQAWLDATDLFYGLDSLTCKMQTWLPLFATELNDLDQSMTRLAQLASGQAIAYINPTNDVEYTDWKVEAIDSPSLDPSKSKVPWMQRSFDATLPFFDRIRAAGCRVHLNSCAPLIHDFHIEIPGYGLFRTEFKVNNPFAPTRMWHILLVVMEGLDFCFTRDEIDGVQEPTWDWIQAHKVSGMEEAMSHMRDHAAQAREEAVRAMHRMQSQPGDLYQGLREYEIRSIQLDETDPLEGPTRTQRLLPWARHFINIQCMKSGYGYCVAFGDGHPVATHAFVEFTWSDVDKENFDVYGTPPLQLWHRIAVENGSAPRRCIPLRFLDISPKPEMSPNSQACLKSYWKKPIEEMRHFLLFGWKGDNDYLLLPSHYTHLSGDKDFLSEPMDRDRGQHMFHHPKNSETELADPAYPSKQRPVVSFGKFLTEETGHDGTFKLSDFFARIQSGEINRQLQAVLQHETEAEAMAKGLELFPNCSGFFGGRYVVNVRRLLQLTWNYGYERALRTHRQKNRDPD